ncbi:hypothetical protein [Ornithinibacillus sp. JPR2-1]|uniref:hypothetical protein n=1 Tax=Ornithinibacillus sp. JPR2-1 TaxID=2094019 RepID=UPI0031E0CD90
MKFEMKGFDNIQKRLKDMSNLKNIPIKCPSCDKDIEASKGKNRCPHCNKDFEFTVN